LRYLAEAVRTISKDFHGVAGSGELRVATKIERQREAERLEAIVEAEEQQSQDHQSEG
jgi:hypothetical protein